MNAYLLTYLLAYLDIDTRVFAEQTRRRADQSAVENDFAFENGRLGHATRGNCCLLDAVVIIIDSRSRTATER